jgi:Right handed beta helix region
MKLSSLRASLAVLATVFLSIQPSIAADYFFSGTGSGFICSQAAPCQLSEAITEAGTSGAPLELACADNNPVPSVTITTILTIDCVGTSANLLGITVGGGASVLRNFTMNNGSIGVTLTHGTVLMDNIHVLAANQNAILAQPTLPSTLIVKNCIIEGGGAILLQPAAGGSLSARFEHVTITGGTGGGIKIDATNGPVTVDIIDSDISGNPGNGVNVVGGAANQAIVSIKNSVIAKNGVAGVQANGAGAGVLVANTLLDQNASGALAVVNSSHISTYGNNQVVGAQGSNFTGTAPLK